MIDVKTSCLNSLSPTLEFGWIPEEKQFPRFWMLRKTRKAVQLFFFFNSYFSYNNPWYLNFCIPYQFYVIKLDSTIPKVVLITAFSSLLTTTNYISKTKIFFYKKQKLNRFIISTRKCEKRRNPSLNCLKHNLKSRKSKFLNSA